MIEDNKDSRKGNGTKKVIQKEKAEDEKIKRVVGVKIIFVFLTAATFFAFSSFGLWFRGGGFPYIDAGVYLPPIGIVGVVILLIFVINPLIKLVAPKKLFRQGHLAIIYIMLLIYGSLIERPFWIFSLIQVQLNTFRKPSVWNPINKNISSLIIPKSQEAIRGFVSGRSSVPWSEWGYPIIFWSAFYTALFILMMCTASILRKRWTDHERLRYPLILPIAEITRNAGESKGFFEGLRKNKLLWGGVSFAFFGALLEFLHGKYPVIPFIDSPGRITSRLVSKMVSGSNWADAFTTTTANGINLSWLGVAYIAPQDVLFSIWFFYFIVQWIFNVLQLGTNLALTKTDILLNDETLAFGGTIAYGLMCLWIMRHQLLAILRKAFGRRSDNQEDDKEEGMSYRTAIFGVLFSMIFLVIYSVYMLQMSLHWAALYFIIFFILLVASSRRRAEAGIVFSYIDPNYWDTNILYLIIGAKRYGVKNLIGVSYFSHLSLSTFGGNTGHVLEGYKLADESGINRKTITKLMFMAFCVAILVYFFGGLPYIYKYGTKFGCLDYGTIGFYRVEACILGSPEPNAHMLKFLVAGGIFTIFLSLMNVFYVWWPFNPIGFMISFNRNYANYSTVAFLAWFFKFLNFRYVGANTYNKYLPFFVGLVIGESVSRFLFTIIWEAAALF